MPREDIEFKTADNVTLRGWFYRPQDTEYGKLPGLVMAHGFSALKEMSLNNFAEHLTSKLALSCLVYDHRGFGASDVKDGHARHKIIPAHQTSDYSDAITYAQSRSDVDADKVWIRCSKLVDITHISSLMTFSKPKFWSDRLARAEGKPVAMLPIVDAGPTKPSALPTADSYKFSIEWEKKCNWENEVTVKTVEATREYMPSAHIHHVFPTPLLTTVAANDVLTPPDIALEAYSRALESKQLNVLPGGHFDAYSGQKSETNAACQTEFLAKCLCS